LPLSIAAKHAACDRQGDRASFDNFFDAVLPDQLLRLEALLTVPRNALRGCADSEDATPAWVFPHRRCDSGPAALHRPSAGELHLFAMLHQALLVRTPRCMRTDGDAKTLRAW